MTLPASQQHALDAIDDVLQSGDRRLATMFGVFTDLTRLESMPAAETLPPGRWWTRYRLPGHRYRPSRFWYQRGRRAGRLGRIVLLPVLLLAAASVVVVSLVSAGPTGRRGCGQAVVVVMSSRLRATTSNAAGTGGAGGPGCRSASPQPASRSR